MMLIFRECLSVPFHTLVRGIVGSIQSDELLRMKDTRADTQKHIECSVDVWSMGSDIECKVILPGINNINSIRR